jgi:hypothetical protein
MGSIRIELGLRTSSLIQDLNPIATGVIWFLQVNLEGLPLSEAELDAVESAMRFEELSMPEILGADFEVIIPSPKGLFWSSCLLGMMIYSLIFQATMPQK